MKKQHRRNWLLILVAPMIMILAPSCSFAVPSVSCIEGNCRDGAGTAVLTDGIVYVGEWEDYNANGSGVITFADGAYYAGAWKNSLPEGFGEYRRPGNDPIRGFFKQGNILVGFNDSRPVRESFPRVTTIHSRYSLFDLYLILAANIAAVMCVSMLFVLVGVVLFLTAFGKDTYHPYFIIGSGFFIGMAVFLSGWRTLEYLFSHCSLMLAVTGAAMMTLVLLKAPLLSDCLRRQKNAFMLRAIVGFALLFAVIAAIVFLNAFQPSGYTVLEPSDHIGSLHTGTYAGIVQFITRNDAIPVLRRSYGQSLLAAITGFMGLENPFLCLYLWLVTSIFMCSVMLYGLFGHFGLSPTWRKIGLAICLVGNSSLSLGYSLVLDSGNPLLFCGYSNSIYSLCSFIILIIWSYHLFRNKVGSRFAFFVILGAIIVSCALTATQNIFLFAALLALMFYPMVKDGNLGKYAFVIAVFSLFAVIGIIQGGLLTPKRFCDEVPIKGIYSENNLDERNQRLLVDPLLPQHYGLDLQRNNENFGEALLFREWPEDIVGFYALLAVVEKNLFDSVRIAFFPIVGIVLCLISAHGSQWAENVDVETFIFYSTTAVFTTGFILVFTFIYGDYIWSFKWALTRFLIPGNVCGMICFAVAMSRKLSAMKSRALSIALTGLILFILMAGPAARLVWTFATSIRNADYVSVHDKLAMLIATVAVR